ncbi:MAG: putative protein kinase UbiB [Alphaproteobacteria bacterium MarineAlpha2_Bin1]|nr:MAG: putative protein kinase UbiB [Alphaproteobacteria bacterium MarineAlpha2_Bin1]
MAKYDCLFLLDHLGVGPLLKIIARTILPKPLKSTKGLRVGQRLSKALQELGPSFIKFGQTWSTRPDLIGNNFADDLAELRDRLPPFDIKNVEKIIKKSFEKDIGEIFLNFDTEPVAAASIAQVHFAVTSSGEEVAVKVLRPGIEKAFRQDIELFKWLANIINKTQSYAERLKPLEIIKKFEETSLLEMDLSIEAAAASELKDNFKDSDYYYVPKVYWSLTSRKVLTTERVNGFSIGNKNKLIEEGIELEIVVENLLKSFLIQVFRDGFFHADLHPGNLFTDKKGRIIPVDFGIMGRMDVKNRKYLAELMFAFLTKDYQKVANIHFDAGYVPSTQSKQSFALACRAIGESVLGKSANEVSIGNLLYKLLRTTEYFKMETQPQLLLLQKTLVVAEGVARQIDPNLILWEKAQNIIENWLRENINIKMQTEETIKMSVERFYKIPKIIDNLDIILKQYLNEKDSKVRDLSIMKEVNSKNSLKLNHWLIHIMLFIVILFMIFDK